MCCWVRFLCRVSAICLLVLRVLYPRQIFWMTIADSSVEFWLMSLFLDELASMISLDWLCSWDLQSIKIISVYFFLPKPSRKSNPSPQCIKLEILFFLIPILGQYLLPLCGFVSDSLQFISAKMIAIIIWADIAQVIRSYSVTGVLFGRRRWWLSFVYQTFLLTIRFIVRLVSRLICF